MIFISVPYELSPTYKLGHLGLIQICDEPDNIHLLHKWKYYSTAELKFDWLGFNQATKSIFNSTLGSYWVQTSPSRGQLYSNIFPREVSKRVFSEPNSLDSIGTFLFGHFFLKFINHVVQKVNRRKTGRLNLTLIAIDHPGMEKFFLE